MNLDQMRRDYRMARLDPESLDTDPLRQFHRWLDDAVTAGLLEPNAMTLATVDGLGQPSARVVLLKDLDERGWVFFTDYRSRKGTELDANPHAALVFWWGELERQVRVRGRAERIDARQSATYFRTRPAGSQLGAWASRQSSELASRDVLDQTLEQVRHRFAGDEIPLPPYWGGYRVVPHAVEFWQGRPDRLHDRIEYRRGAGGGWRLVRLSP